MLTASEPYTLSLTPSGDADHQQRGLQVLQDPSAHGEDSSDWRQVCQSPRSEGNMWHHVQAGGEGFANRSSVLQPEQGLG